MSIWPLVTQVVGHEHGVNRILYPALTWLLGRHSYYNVGNDLLALSLVPLAIVALVRKKRLAQPGRLSTAVGNGLGVPSHARDWNTWLLFLARYISIGDEQTGFEGQCVLVLPSSGECYDILLRIRHGSVLADSQFRLVSGSI